MLGATKLDGMVHLGQYIHDRIQILNRLDGEIRRVRHEMQQKPPACGAESCTALVDQLKSARDAVDGQLFELYAHCRGDWATPDKYSASEACWKHLRETCQQFHLTCGDLTSGEFLQVLDLITHLEFEPRDPSDM